MENIYNWVLKCEIVRVFALENLTAYSSDQQNLRMFQKKVLRWRYTKMISIICAVRF